ncbi:hypothetical protein [Pseudoalteromonas sp. GB56]
MKLISTMLLSTLLTFSGFTAYAGDGEWEKIADKKVSFKSETDTVNPMSPFADSHFSHIKIKCTNGTVNLKKITVYMSNGEEREFDNLGILNKGMSSRSLNLPNKDGAKLDKIKLKYESVGSTATRVAGVTEKAEVEILGKKAEKDKDKD